MDDRSASLLRWFGGVLASPRYVHALGVMATLVAVASRYAAYPGGSANRDESVYQWQTELLAKRRLSMSDFGFGEILQPWLTGRHNGEIFSQYPPGWPLVMSVGRLVGWPELTLIIASIVAILGTYALALEITRERRVAGLSATLLVLSPIVAIHSGVFLTYLFASGVGAIFTTCVLAGVRLASRRWLLGTGACLGILILTRPFDAVLWAVAVLGYVVVTERHQLRELQRLAPTLIVATLPFVLGQLAFNNHLTGSPLRFPISVADPLDAFGFGERRMMPGIETTTYDLGIALESAVENLMFLPWFVLGGYIGAIAAVAAVVGNRRRRSTWLLVSLGVVFPVGYLGFWGTTVAATTSPLHGPIYYIPVYVPLCILMAQGLIIAFRRALPMAMILSVAALAMTIPMARQPLLENRQISETQKVWSDSLASIDRPALVVVSEADYLIYMNPNSANDATLSDDVIWATDADPSLLRFIQQHPDRTAYIQRAVAAGTGQHSGSPRPLYDLTVDPAELVTGPVLAISATYRAAAGSQLRGSLSIGGDVVATTTHLVATSENQAIFTWKLGAQAEGAATTIETVPNGGSRVELLIEPVRQHDKTGLPSVRYEFLLHRGPALTALVPGSTAIPGSGVGRTPGWTTVGSVDGFEVLIQARSSR